MIFSTDAGVYPHGLNAQQFAVMVRYGMTPLQAIQSATCNAAEALGRKDVGRTRSGASATWSAYEGDPLADVTVLEKPVFVMKGGELITQRLTRPFCRVELGAAACVQERMPELDRDKVRKDFDEAVNMTASELKASGSRRRKAAPSAGRARTGRARAKASVMPAAGGSSPFCKTKAELTTTTMPTCARSSATSAVIARRSRPMWRPRAGAIR